MTSAGSAVGGSFAGIGFILFILSLVRYSKLSEAMRTGMLDLGGALAFIGLIAGITMIAFGGIIMYSDAQKVEA